MKNAGGGKKLARRPAPFTPKGVKQWRWLGLSLMAGVAVVALQAQGPDIDLPRPGNILAADVTGEVAMVTGEQRRILKTDDRIRVGATIVTGRRSMTTLHLSNGASLELGSETEIEIEEFGQAPVTGSTKFLELKAEPTLSRTRLRLVRGEITAKVKPLKVTRGSLFTLTTLAGTLRLGEGVFRTMLRMHDLGIGVCSVELQSGTAEFEVVGASAFAPLPAGRKLVFAIEVDKAGVVKIGEMPKETPKGK